MCDGMAEGPIPCCARRLCGSCVINLVDSMLVDRSGRMWYIVCPFCRGEVGVPDRNVKQLLAESCPHHAKALGVGRRVAVRVPDAHGHYDSPDSVLYVHNVVAMRAMEQANEDLWIVLADVVERWGRSVSRTHQYGQGRASRDREDGRRDREHGGDAGRSSRSC